MTKIHQAVATAIVAFTTVTGAQADPATAPTPAHSALPALEQTQAIGLHGRTGIGIAVAPDYLGAHRLSVTPLPDLSLAYGTRNFGTFVLGNSGLLWSAVQTQHFNAGPMIGFDAGRKEHTNGLRSSRDIPRLRGIGEIRPTATYGGFATLAYDHVVFNAQAQAARSGHGHGGARGSIGIDLPFEFASAQWTLSSAVNIADQHYLQSYFGVSTTQAQRSGLKAFAPGRGIMSYDLSLTAALPLKPRWSLSLTAGAERLVRDAARSPLVERKTQPIAAAMFSYTF